jgi:hypothetical protein
LNSPSLTDVIRYVTRTPSKPSVKRLIIGYAPWNQGGKCAYGVLSSFQFYDALLSDAEVADEIADVGRERTSLAVDRNCDWHWGNPGSHRARSSAGHDGFVPAPLTNSAAHGMPRADRSPRQRWPVLCFWDFEALSGRCDASLEAPRRGRPVYRSASAAWVGPEPGQPSGRWHGRALRPTRVTPAFCLRSGT